MAPGLDIQDGFTQLPGALAGIGGGQLGHQDDWSCLFLGSQGFSISVISLHGLSEGYLDFLDGISGLQKYRSRSFQTLRMTLLKHRQDQPQVSTGVATQVSAP